LNRDEIGACSYVSRRPREALRSQEPQPDSKHLQNKIDRLEQLVLSFIGNDPKAQRPISSGGDDGGIHASRQKSEHIGDLSDEDDDVGLELQVTDNDNPKDLGVVSKSSVMKIHADYRQSHAIDEAHWAQLLNEVRHILALRK
jgi:hypothetical protein